MSQNKPAENKMGTMPVNRLLLSMSIPIMISMLVQALYNVVDSIFVAQLSEDALNAVSLAFPIQNLMISVAVGTGVGINALLSKSLGEKRQDRANAAAMNGLFLAAVSYLVFMLIGLTCSRLFFAIQTDKQTIVDYGESYMFIVCVLSVGMFFQITFERILQATGRTLYTMFTQALGAIINIVLDPILIFGLFGLPRMEVAGAALATVLGQIIAALVSVVINATRNPDVQLSLKGFRPQASIIGHIYAVGVPSIIMSSIGSVMVFGMNKILIAFTTTATAVFGVYFKLQSFVFMPIFGVNSGLIPILSYNYGAKSAPRLSQAVRFGVQLALSAAAAGAVLLALAAGPLLRYCFHAGGAAAAMGVPALRMAALSFPIAAVSIILSAAFQSLGHSGSSLLIALLRQILLLLPIAALFLWLVPDGVWLSFLIAETITCVATLLLYRRTVRPLIAALAVPGPSSDSASSSH